MIISTSTVRDDAASLVTLGHLCTGEAPPRVSAAHAENVIGKSVCVAPEYSKHALVDSLLQSAWLPLVVRDEISILKTKGEWTPGVLEIWDSGYMHSRATENFGMNVEQKVSLSEYILKLPSCRHNTFSDLIRLKT